jgi:alkane 1-monooxygenase
MLGLVFFLGQSLVAAATLEATNYIEHFGLSREEISPGVYAPVKDTHSWDTNYRMTNWFLLNLGRHAHHHTAPTVPYENGKSSVTKNKLRYGYSTEVLLALIGKKNRAVI